MPRTDATAFKVDRERKVVYKLTVKVPRLLKIDPRGHFTWLRIVAIMWLDRLGVRFKCAIHPIANACEFLANYPTL